MNKKKGKAESFLALFAAWLSGEPIIYPYLSAVPCASAPLREDPFALFIIHYTDTADKRNVAYKMQRYIR